MSIHLRLEQFESRVSDYQDQKKYLSSKRSETIKPQCLKPRKSLLIKPLDFYCDRLSAWSAACFHKYARTRPTTVSIFNFRAIYRFIPLIYQTTATVRMLTLSWLHHKVASKPPSWMRSLKPHRLPQGWLSKRQSQSSASRSRRMLRWERGNFKALVNGFNHWAGIASSHCDVTTGGGGVRLTRRRETFERDLFMFFLKFKITRACRATLRWKPVLFVFSSSWDGILNNGESGKGALNRLQFEQREIGVRIVISIIENHQLRKLNY